MYLFCLKVPLTDSTLLDNFLWQLLLLLLLLFMLLLLLVVVVAVLLQGVYIFCKHCVRVVCLVSF